MPENSKTNILEQAMHEVRPGRATRGHMFAGFPLGYRLY